MRIEVKEDLFIRSIEERDAERTYQIIVENKEHLSRWFGWVKYTKSVESRLGYIKDVIEEREKNEGDDFVIVHKGKVIGIIGYIMKNEHSAFIGYWIEEDRQGNGFVTMSAKVLIENLIKVKGLHRIEIKVAEDNSRSRALAERLNLKYEGTLRDVDFRDGRYESEAIYSILDSEI